MKLFHGKSGAPVGTAVLTLASAFLLGGCAHEAKDSYRLGEEMMKEKDYVKAAAAFDQACGYDPTSCLYYTKAGLAYLYTGDYGRAQTALEKALELDQEDYDANREMGLVCAAQGECLRAVDYYNAALASTGMWTEVTDYDVMEYRADAELRAKLYDDALDTYAALVQLEYHVSANYYRMGMVYLMRNQPDQAQVYFDNAITKDPEDFRLYIDIYYSLMESKKTEQAEEYLNRAAQITANSDEDYLVKGEVFYRRGQYEEALASLNLVNGMDMNGKLYLSRAACYVALGDYTNAAAQYNEYISIYGHDAQVLNELAVCAIHQGQYPNAIQFLTDALAIPGAADIPEIKWNLIVAYEKSGDINLAYVKAVEYVNNFPYDEKAETELVYLEKQLGIYTGEETEAGTP